MCLAPKDPGLDSVPTLKDEEMPKTNRSHSIKLPYQTKPAP